VEAFVRWYNTEHRHSAIQFVTPAQRHSGQHVIVLSGRKEVYEEARRNRPDRSSGQVRSWEPTGEVVLNPSVSSRASRPVERTA